MKKRVCSLVDFLGLDSSRYRVRRAKGTTFPVFLFGSVFVVKLFDSLTPWERELAGLAICAKSEATMHLVPVLLASGKLCKHWHFVVVSQLEGQCVRLVGSMAAHDAVHMAVVIGRALRVIHQPDDEKNRDVHLRDWCELLSVRKRALPSQKWLKKRIRKESAWNQLQPNSSFWPVNWTSLFRWGDWPRYLHGDLNNENVLYDKRNGRFGLLDFGDSFYGHCVYDFVAVHLSVFACSKQLLSICLHNYGLDLLPESPKSFAYACMVYMLLSDSPAFKTASFCRPQVKDCDTLEEMAEILFDLTVEEK